MRWPLSAEERFMLHVSPEPNTGCWLWTGSTEEKRYGQFFADGRTISAHRWAYLHWRGPIAGGLCVLHRCDQPCCANPAHLWLGTNRENVDDRQRKRRSAMGARNGGAKLTTDAVLAIRSDTRSQRQIAAAYGLSIGYVQRLRAGRRWTHV